MNNRDIYIYKNGKIYSPHNQKPLKYNKLEGCHNNYQISFNNKTFGYLKQSMGFADYADVISKRICDEIKIDCAECELVYMYNFPQGENDTLLSYEEHVEFCKSHFNITDENTLRQSYEDYCNQFKINHEKPALISYDYQNEQPYKSAKIINLGELVSVYCEVTGNQSTIAIETYVKIAQELSDKKSKIGKAMRKKLKLKNNIELSQSFDLDLKKIALLGYVTCQTDMRSYNIHLALIKTKKGYSLEVAPLFDNGESFNLSNLNAEQDKTQEDVDSVYDNYSHIGNWITITENESNSPDSQLVGLAQEILSNPELSKYYDILRWLDIDEICDHCDIGEDNFHLIKYSVVSNYNTRINLLEQEIKRQQEQEQEQELVSENISTNEKSQINSNEHTDQNSLEDGVIDEYVNEDNVGL